MFNQEEDFLVTSEALVNAIPSLFCPSNFDGSDRDFLPEQSLVRVITPEAIAEELSKFTEGLHLIKEDSREGVRREYTTEFRQQLATWIWSNARRTFAAMVHCNLGPLHLLLSMQKCRDTNFDDHSLPLRDPSSLPNSWNRSIWTISKLRDFYDKQWRFLVPVFSPDDYNYNHQHMCIFPFTKMNVTPRVGAFSTVHKVGVHPDHQKHENMEIVAIKEIQIIQGDDRTKLDTDEAWEQEARALENINTINHEHIIKCVAAIRRGNSRYFMFPWADGDSLRDYWDSFPKRGPDAETIYQAIKQIRGLSDALDRLHNFYENLQIDNHRNAMDVDNASLNTPNLQVQDEHNRIFHPVEVPSRDNIRHGDLKPENILCFSGSGPGPGTLKIADMGLAKRHIDATQYRKHLTSTRYGTIHYEPPEAAPGFQGSRSRLYDIWSMGCITLEMIIWILHGNEVLNDFYQQVKGGTNQVCQYYKIIESAQGHRAIVHPVVRQWIQHLQTSDPECSQDSALSDLLQTVKDKLLVVPLKPSRASALDNGHGFVPPEDDETITRYRCTAAEFRDTLDTVLAKAHQNPNYLFVGKSRHNVKPPLPESSSSLTPSAAERDAGPFPSTNLLGQPAVGILSNHTDRSIRLADYTLPPLKDWEFNVDNVFAEQLVGQIQAMDVDHKRGVLCNRCIGLNFWAGGFSMGDTMAALVERSESCDFCRLLAKACGGSGNVVDGRVQIERKQSNLVLLGDSFPLLSIYRSPDSRPPFPIQLGLPQLPRPGSDMFFAIIKLWLKDCTEEASHNECQVTAEVKLPTRLIDVGSQSAPSLRLIETATEKVVDDVYIALSHPWGDTKTYTPFRTLRKDPSGAGRDLTHFTHAIPEDELPATFRDAVICTRKLGVRYLWIDSICILQGDDGDFNAESKKMEDVYSGAHCVIAASRANSQLDGFLGARPQREYVTFQRAAEKPFYVCETIDNFSRDVIEGALNRRGWVLQERALARRTVYFAENQTYFECGRGVRCETLTSMRNNMADFLGDPRFPTKAMRTTSKALKISYFQELYKQYSRLGFTRSDDRPFAIAGLEKRLLKAYGTAGGYGVFDDGTDAEGGLFHRSLLWQRGEEAGDAAELTPIEFPAKRNIHVPSWSWMAYEGGIEYADPPFQTAKWETKDIVPPWTKGGTRNTSSAPHTGVVTITATVRDYAILDAKPNEAKLVFDRARTAGSDGRRAHCVVVARSNERRSEDRRRRFYVLLVGPTLKRNAHGEQTYRRIGVGFMLGRFIDLKSAGVLARIV